jgi:hypothetical protein
MKRTLILAGLAVGLLVPATASAHNSNGWYWSAKHAADRLEDNNYTYAKCFPWGDSIRASKHSKRRLYRHFECAFVDAELSSTATLHVKGKRAFKLTNFHTANGTP